MLNPESETIKAQKFPQFDNIVVIPKKIEEGAGNIKEVLGPSAPPTTEEAPPTEPEKETPPAEVESPPTTEEVPPTEPEKETPPAEVESPPPPTETG